MDPSLEDVRASVQRLQARDPAVMIGIPDRHRVGGIVDVIKDGSTGLLVPEKDPEAIAAAVLRLLDDPVLARRLGEEGFAHACRFFDWEAITDQLEAVYQRACRAERSPEALKVATKSVSA